MLSLLARAVVLVASAMACAGAPQLTCDTVWVLGTPVLNLSTPLALTFKDVVADWAGRLGCRPPVVSTLPPAATSSAAAPPGEDGAVTVIVFGEAGDPFVGRYGPTPAGCTAGAEAHCLYYGNATAFGGQVLLVVGSDRRGLQFAAYALAEEVLGVGPFDYWLQIGSEQVDTIAISKSLPIVYRPPAFERRAFFINDEDLLGGFANDPLGQSVWSIDTWDRMYSTILRIKGNGVLPGTNTFPDDPGYLHANRRGLFVTSHHYNLLAMSPVVQESRQWFPEAYNYQQRPDAMMYAWEASVTVQSQFEDILYTIGYRGAGDTPAQCLGPCTEIDKAEHVSWVLGNQTDLVRRYDRNPRFLTWLWGEGLAYLETGKLAIPPNTTVVFADRGNGEVKGLEYAKGNAGIYTHVAMHDRRANQLAEMVPVARIFGNIAKFVQVNATKIFILNVSDLLPYVLGTWANFKSVWDPSLVKCNITVVGECEAVEGRWIAEWASELFRVDAADAAVVAKAMRIFYNVSYIVNEGRGDEYVALTIHTLADALVPSGAGRQTGTGRDGEAPEDWALDAAQLCAALGMVAPILGRIPAARQQAFRATVLNSIGFHCHGTSAIVSLANATAALAKGDAPGVVAGLAAARSSATAMLAVLDAMAGARFKGIIAHDNIACAGAAREAVIAALDRFQPSVVGAAVRWAGNASEIRCQDYAEMYAYQDAFAREHFPLQNGFNLRWNMYLWPQAYCAYGDAGASWCLPHPKGGSFHGSANITLKTARGLPVRYTTDGSQPTPSSPVATGPVVISETTTFTVSLANASAAPDMPATVMVFTRLG